MTPLFSSGSPSQEIWSSHPRPVLRLARQEVEGERRFLLRKGEIGVDGMYFCVRRVSLECVRSFVSQSRVVTGLCVAPRLVVVHRLSKLHLRYLNYELSRPLLHPVSVCSRAPRLLWCADCCLGCLRASCIFKIPPKSAGEEE